jgi:hypothetical protein
MLDYLNSPNLISTKEPLIVILHEIGSFRRSDALRSDSALTNSDAIVS